MKRKIMSSVLMVLLMAASIGAITVSAGSSPNVPDCICGYSVRYICPVEIEPDR